MATDGELYGHHLPFRDLFLEALTTTAPAQLGLELTTLGDLVSAAAAPGALPLRAVTIRDQTSWSCHHGILRWSGECPDAPDGRWKRPLRSALERLAAALDVVTEREASALGVDLWAARDAWADVAAGFAEPAEGTEMVLRPAAQGRPARAPRAAGRSASSRFEAILRAQTSRLAMFASDAWFWDDPARPETAQSMRLAAHAARLVDGLAGTRLEAGLVADLAALRSPTTRLDGAALYGQALRTVDQPAPAA
jgi:hypothetical protein